MKKFRFCLLLFLAAVLCCGLTVQAAAVAAMPGDVNGDGAVNVDDALYLMQHIAAPKECPLAISGDIDRNGRVDRADALLLLRHTLSASRYPLTCQTHIPTTLAAVAPTCEAPGLTAGSYCSYCGTLLAEPQIVPALGHTPADTGWVQEATCTQDGYRLLDCRTCGKPLVEETLRATGHSFGAYETVVAPGCDTAGKQERSCTGCGLTEQATLAATGHDYVLNETGLVQCQLCGLQTGSGSLADVNQGGHLLEDCPVDFTFVVIASGDEAAVRRQIDILDVHYQGADNESDGLVDFTLTALGNGRWQVDPALEPRNSYRVTLDDGAAFEDHPGQQLTVDVAHPPVTTTKLSANLIWIRFPENEAALGYELWTTEDSDFIYLTLPERGLFTDEYIGRVVCAGDYGSMEELEALPGLRATFGKIRQILPLADGRCILVLECPELYEVYDQLDIHHYEHLVLSEEDLPADMDQRVIAAIYASEGFSEFVAQAIVSTELYAQEHQMTLVTRDASSILKNLKLTPSFKTEGSLVKVSVTGTLSVPIKNDEGKVGSVDFSFTTSLDFTIKIKLESDFYRGLVTGIPYGVKSFEVSATRESTFNFQFSVTVNLEKSFGDNGETIYCTPGGSYHLGSCIRLDQLDKDTLVKLTPQELDRRFRKNPEAELGHQCAVCRPITYYLQGRTFFRSSTGTVHRFLCTTPDRFDTIGVLMEELPTQGSYCEDCRPQGIKIPDFSKYMAESSKYQDWAKVLTEVTKLINPQGDEGSGREVPIPIPARVAVGPFTVGVEASLILEFKFQGTLTYKYSYAVKDSFGIRKQQGDGIEAFHDKYSSTSANSLEVSGKLGVEAGVKVGISGSIIGLEKYVKVGIYAEAGVYANLSGVLYVGTETTTQGDTSTTNTDTFGAAYLEVGVFYDVTFDYKVVIFRDSISLLGGEKRIPLLKVGYDRYYYNVSPKTDYIDITGNSVDLSRYSLLNSKYYNLKTLTHGTEGLNIRGQSGKYNVTILLLDENGNPSPYATVENGVVTLTDDAPCDVTLQVVIRVEGIHDPFSTVEDFLSTGYISGSACYDLEELTVRLRLSKHTYGEWTDYIAPTCTEYGQQKRSYICECHGTAVEVMETRPVAALGHNPVTTPAVKMNCTTDGLTEGSHCNRCGHVFVAQIRTPARGHKYTDGFTCHDRPCTYSDCRHVEAATTPHRYSEWIEGTAGGCSGQDFKLRICNDCGHVSNDQGTEGLQVGHQDLQRTDWKNASCTANGYVDLYCSACGYQDHQVLQATGHRMSAYLYDAAQHYKLCLNPNCSHREAVGDHSYTNSCDTTCNTCGYQRQITHTWSQTYHHDDTLHWRTCTVCGQADIKTAHTGGIATCTEQAVCLTCQTGYGSLADHVYGPFSTAEEAVKSPATCQRGTEYYHSCQACGKLDTGTGFISGDPVDHLWDTVYSYSAGYHYRSCTFGCGATTDRAAHVYDRAVANDRYLCAPATCLEQASYYYSCVCGHCGTNTFRHGDPGGHREQARITAPTCTEQGYTTYTCLLCGNSRTDGFTAALGHKDAVVTTQPTCTALGYDRHTCSRCQRIWDDNYTDALGHSFTAGSLLEAPTCQSTGIRQYRCGRCGVIERRTEATVGHSWNGEYLCTDSVHYKLCDFGCGTRSVLTDHVYDQRRAEQAYLISEASCVNADEYRLSCICGHAGTETFFVGSPLGHSYRTEIISPTCTEQGCQLHICSRCGDSFANHYTPQTGHDWREATCDCPRACTRCGISEGEPLGHIWLDATCTDPMVCSRCFATHGNKLGHDYIAATCEAPAVCHRCGKTNGQPLGHDWANGQVTVEATCTVEGSRNCFCRRCGDTKVESIPKKDHEFQRRYDQDQHWDGCVNCTARENIVSHSWDAAYSHDDTAHWFVCTDCEAISGYESHAPGMATCTEQAVCITCGNRYGALAPHSYTIQSEADSYLKTAATCTGKGVYYYSCICGKTNGTTFTVPALGHDYADSLSFDQYSHYRSCQRPGCSSVTDKASHFGGMATCTDQAQCDGCGSLYGTALGHDYTEASGAHLCASATCTAPACYYYGCTRCDSHSNNTYSIGQALGHDWGTDYLCSDSGHTLICRRCNGKDWTDHSWDTQRTLEPTCYLEGRDTHTCRICAHVITTQVEKTAHIHEAYLSILTDGPVTGSNGETTYIHKVGYRCVNYDYCGYFYATGEEIEHPHLPTSKTGYDPTCTEPGLTPTTYCGNGDCDHVYFPAEPIPALGHDIVDGVCTRCKCSEGSTGLSYRLSSDGSYYILTGRGTCTDTVISVPQIYLGKPVREVDSGAFYNNTKVTQVILPEGLTAIGSDAFCGCKSLTEVYIPDSVTSLGDYAFYQCASLTGITLPVSALGKSAFHGCTNLSQVTFTGSLTSLGSDAFAYCASLTEVALPQGLTTIGEAAFHGCTELTAVSLPESLSAIGEGAFHGCAKLVSINLPRNLTRIEESAFFDCVALTELEIPVGVIHIGPYAFFGCTGLTSMKLPMGITALETGVLSNCFHLTALTIPVSVTSIGTIALQNCTRLETICFEGTTEQWNAITKGASWATSAGYATANKTYQLICLGDPQGSQGLKYTLSKDGTYYSVTGLGTCTDTEIVIPATYQGKPVKVIANNAFGEKTQLVSVFIPEGVTTIEGWAFQMCEGLIEVHIPDSVNSIEWYAFCRCTSLTKINLPEGIQCIDEATFAACASLTQITIPQSVTSIGYGAFLDCTSLMQINIPAGVTSIGGSAFEDCTSLTQITIPEGVTSIGSSAFQRCTSLTQLTIPEGVTSIEETTFADCVGLETINLPQSILRIESCAFIRCTSLTEIRIPENVTSIGTSAFDSCTGLTSVTMPNGITAIDYYAFEECTSLEIIYFEGTTEQWNAITKRTNWNTGAGTGTAAGTYRLICLGDPQGSQGLKYTLSKDGTYYSVTGLGSCTDTDIVIPSTHQGKPVKAIASSAFAGKTQIVSVSIPEGVTLIDSSAFSNCTGLERVDIPKSVTVIKYYAFENCSSLTSINIPEGVTTVECGTFIGCSNLREVILPQSLTLIEEDVFQNCTSLTRIVIPEGVTTIMLRTFMGCTSLTEVILPSYIASIGNYAFYKCTSLTEVIIPEGVISIGDHAFAYCGSLTKINIPASVETIMGSAFRSCSSLTSVHIPSLDGWVSISFKDAYSNPLRYAGNLYINGQPAAEIAIPEGTAEIKQYAFAYCTNITSITIPQSVTNIGDYGAAWCTKLETIYFEGTTAQWDAIAKVSAWASMAGSETANKTYQLICLGDPQGSQGLEYQLGNNGTDYYSVVGLGTCTDTDIVIPATYQGKPVIAVTANAFQNCTGIHTVTIPEGVTYVGSYAFQGCTGLTGVTFAQSITAVGDGIFSGCTGLTEFFYPQQVKRIADETFYGCTGLTKVTIPQNKTAIGTSAFSGCTGLTEILLPESITSIGVDAFYGCTGLTEITLPQSLTSIQGYAFAGCTGLTSVTLPKKVTVLESRVFYNCTGLKEITIPVGVTSIGDLALCKCSKLETICFEGTTEQWNAITKGANWNTGTGTGTAAKTYQLICLGDPQGSQGLTYTLSRDGTYYYVTGLGTCTDTEVVIPATYQGKPVKEIGLGAFYCCNNLVKITIPEGVISIGSWAFDSCTSLTEVTLPTSVISIGTQAFYNCTSLTEIIIPEGIPSIGDYAFQKCTSLTEINIPEGVTRIEAGAFWECTSLKAIHLPQSVVAIGEGAVGSCANLETIYFEGTTAQWEAITKETGWDINAGADTSAGSYRLICLG